LAIVLFVLLLANRRTNNTMANRRTNNAMVKFV